MAKIATAVISAKTGQSMPTHRFTVIRRAFEPQPAFVLAALHHGTSAVATGERRDMMADSGDAKFS
jgi:hypothetical protein